jgi:hypothetical protein
MTLFGWCIDAHHENCREEFTYETKLVQCECNCHERTTNVEETQERDSELAIPPSVEEVQ